MFPDMSSYAKLNRLDAHKKPSKSVMEIRTYPVLNILYFLLFCLLLDDISMID